VVALPSGYNTDTASIYMSNKNNVVNFAGSLLCGVIYAQLPRQVKVDKKSLFNTIIQVDTTIHK